MEQYNYSAEALKERGHGVIEESKWENFDKMVDNNCKSWMGLRYVNNVLLLCEIMHNEAMPLADRRRQAYDKFQEFDCNGMSTHMICGALLDLCTDGVTLAEEILDFKYDPNGSLLERCKTELDNLGNEKPSAAERIAENIKQLGKAISQVAVKASDLDGCIVQTPPKPIGYLEHEESKTRIPVFKRIGWFHRCMLRWCFGVKYTKED